MTNLDHELRAKGIGSSEIAMLVIDDQGRPLSPWGGPHKLWRKKTGQDVEEGGDRPWLDRGNALEGWILDRYAKKSMARLRRSPGTRQHNKYHYCVDSADALAWLPGDEKTPSAVIEAKAPLMWTVKEWGEEGTNQIPRQYLVQGQWHMGAWSLPRCDYPIDAGGDIKIYTSEHDEELWLCLLQIAERFWIDHVLTGKPPPVDAREETSQWLSRRLEQRNEDIVEADEETVKKMLTYRELRLRYDTDEENLKLLANELKQAIGEHKGLHLPGDTKSKITFSEVKGQSKFETDRYIEALIKLLPEGVAPPERQEYTKPGAPYRRFLPTGLMKGEDK